MVKENSRCPKPGKKGGCGGWKLQPPLPLCPWLCLRPPCGLTKDSPGADVCAGQPPGLGVKKRKKPRIIIIPILQTMKWRDREAKYLALNPTGDKSQSQDSDSGSLRTPQHYVLKHVLKQVSILRVAIYCLLPNLFVWNIEIRESQPEKLNWILTIINVCSRITFKMKNNESWDCKALPGRWLWGLVVKEWFAVRCINLGGNK